MRKILSYTFIWLLLLGCLQSCVKEDLTDCPSDLSGLRLRFSTLYEDLDLDYKQDVQHVKVYIFDSNDRLCAIEEGKGSCLSNDFSMDIDLQPGNYKILTWGADKENLLDSYGEAVFDAETTAKEEKITIGVTKLSEMHLFLKGEAGETTLLAPNRFNDLYYGIAGSSQYGTLREVSVVSNQRTEERIDLIRNTNLVDLTVIGMDYLTKGLAVTPENIAISITGKGECYDKGNAFGTDSRDVRFIPSEMTNVDGKWRFPTQVQRLIYPVGSSLPLPLVFTIFDKVNNKELYKLNILETLMKVKDDRDQNLYQNQADFDKRYVHSIELVVDKSGLIVTVTVNGWTVINITPAK